MERITYTDVVTKTVLSDIIFVDDTIWMTQEQMGLLYGKAQSTVSEHIKKIYQDGELKEWETLQTEANFGISENTTPTTENSFKKPKNYYNLQMIIAVGFKVNSPQAISFRKRANIVIEQYTKHGYVLDDERLKGGKTLGGKRDYDQLMERVRVIRFDERNIYEKIKDLFTTAIDYELSSEYANFSKPFKISFIYWMSRIFTWKIITFLLAI